MAARCDGHRRCERFAFQATMKHEAVSSTVQGSGKRRRCWIMAPIYAPHRRTRSRGSGEIGAVIR
jgi:hypothetical protein